MVLDAQHAGTALRSKSFTMVPCQIPVNYEIAIPNSMTLGTGGKWLHQHRNYSLWPGLLEGILSLTKRSGRFGAFPKLSSRAIYYCGYALFSCVSGGESACAVTPMFQLVPETV